jgi:hypothetical protein
LYQNTVHYFHGGNDRRTGFVQGEMLFQALKVLGRPVEYVVHQNYVNYQVEITDNEWINCCEPLNSLKGGLIKVKRTSHQLWLITIYPMMMKITLTVNTL